MIDFHTHILPGIDDGSRTPAMTEGMLREEAGQGVTLIAATPHFYPNRMSVDGFLSRRAEALETTERIRLEAGIPLPEIICGAEVYYFRGMGKAEMIPRMCIGDTKSLLLEMPFEQWEAPMLADVKDLLDRGLHVVLAHVERYESLQRKRDTWDRVMALPVMKQINAGSFLKVTGLAGLAGGNRTRNFCLQFLKEHEETLIGSDCHNMSGRKPNLIAAKEAITAQLGEAAFERTQRTALRMMTGI